ncbi:MAG: cytochrome C oxidase subunit IV family protein [Fimbriimonas sp.]
MHKTPLQKVAATQEANHHVVSTKTSIAVLIALTVLMFATIAAAEVHLPAVWMNNVVAMAIAMIKAGLVMTFFMGLKWATGLTKLWAGAGFVVFILMFIILLDYGTRSFEVVPSWGNQEATATPRVVDPAGQHQQPDKYDANFRPRY